MDGHRGRRWNLVVGLVVALTGWTGLSAPAAAIEFKASKFRSGGVYDAAMVRAWERGRSAAKASGFFLANRHKKLLVMTGKHVVGRHPVFVYRGRRSTFSKRVLQDKDVAVYEVGFGASVNYHSVGKFHIAMARPRLGQSLTVVGYPRGFSGSLMASSNCELMPRTRLLHPSFFSCADLDRWCDYAEKVGKSRTTCRTDAANRKHGRPRQCTLPLNERYTKHERHAQSTHAMNCAVRLGNSGGPVLLAGARSRRAVIGMPSAVFARVYGSYPDDVGVGFAAFSQRFKARAKRFGIDVR